MRTFIKVLLPLYLVLLLVCGMTGGPAYAENNTTSQLGLGISAKGIIEASAPITVFTPMGGQVGDFAWIPGDRLGENALAFSLRPAMIYAAADGVIVGLHAQTGDLVAGIAAQYGAPCYIQRQDIWHIQAAITATSGDAEKRDVRIGQVLRVQHGTGADKVRGEGTVISRTDKEFVLEILKGEFDLEDSVQIYLGTSKDNASADQIGSGKIVRTAALPATGEGMIATVLVRENEKVTRGQPLFILDSLSSRYTSGQQVQPEVRIPHAGVIGEVLVGPGQFIAQGQAVMTVLPLDALEATLEVDELDIGKVRVGDTVRVSVDAYRQERTGTVTEIRSVGRVVLDTTKFLVKVAFEKSNDLLIGMHVTAYWD